MTKNRKRPSQNRPKPQSNHSKTASSATPGKDDWQETLQKLEEVTAKNSGVLTKPARPQRSTAANRIPKQSPAARQPSRIDVDPQAVEPLRGIEKFANELEPHTVKATYWLDTAGWSGGPELTIRFRGQRSGVEPGESDTFIQDQVVRDIVPDSGKIAVTGRRPGLPRGLWRVQASPLHEGKEQTGLAQTSQVRSLYDAVAFGPGVNLLSWPLLVGAGGLVAVLLQVFFMVAAGWPWWQPFVITSAALLVGMVGARLWALRLHGKPLREFIQAGACIQGFLLGAAITMLLGALIAAIPLGLFFDLSAPGIFLALAIGRPGCFFTGCCFGRPTPAKWGLWSSDRREGRRRYPVQLLEAAMALLIAGLAFTAVLVFEAAGTGAIFLLGMLLYTIGRQFLFPLRKQPRTPRGRLLTILASFAGILVVIGYAAAS